MDSPLAFDRDPLFSKRSEPLIKVDTRLNQQKQRFWIWKMPDFFWFWNQDEPDFFGVFLEGTPQSKMSFPGEGKWFEEAKHTQSAAELKRILRLQLHNRNWARALTFKDPRPEKEGVWRVLWRRHEFLLQNAFTGRAVRFFPESHWPKGSPHWRNLNGLLYDAAFFTDIIWPLLTERRGRLKTAFEFLELPIAEQTNPIRFRRGDIEEFLTIIRAALTLDHTIIEHSSSLSLRFHPLNFEPVVGSSWLSSVIPYSHQEPTKFIPNSRIGRLALAFSPYLIEGFASHSVAPSPLSMCATRNGPSLYTSVSKPFTAHECIEASLTVRGWISQNAPALLEEWTHCNEMERFFRCCHF